MEMGFYDNRYSLGIQSVINYQITETTASVPVFLTTLMIYLIKSAVYTLKITKGLVSS